MNICLIAYYYPPVNSSGAKRFEALSKYLAAMGHSVTVITTRKTLADGEFTESVPPGVTVVEIDAFGREAASSPTGAPYQPLFVDKPSLKRRVKDAVMRWAGQIPDPRLPFAVAFLLPWLSVRAKDALRRADVVIGTSPPWPMLLAALIVKYRFGVPCVLDYRDHFSECHEMPGGALAKATEKSIDRALVARADQVVAISQPMASYYTALKGVPAATILNGYDPESM